MRLCRVQESPSAGLAILARQCVTFSAERRLRNHKSYQQANQQRNQNKYCPYSIHGNKLHPFVSFHQNCSTESGSCQCFFNVLPNSIFFVCEKLEKAGKIMRYRNSMKSSNNDENRTKTCGKSIRFPKMWHMRKFGFIRTICAERGKSYANMSRERTQTSSVFIAHLSPTQRRTPVQKHNFVEKAY